ncbi:hypothetical protein [Rhizobium sp. NPDC090279]|uniref:hypothetical protein n=1 Tax=Rhizobium sp. NPDC090279 TaxID=3364499 RepID=UPI003839DBFA
MLHTIIAPNAGHPVVHHIGEGASVWGHAITASIAHLIQLNHEIELDYSLIGAGVVFQRTSGAAMLPHVLGENAVRLQVEKATFRRAAGNPQIGTGAIACVSIGDSCILKLWGHIAVDDSSMRWDHPMGSDRGITVPAIFTVSFWEVSRTAETRLSTLLRETAEKDRRIRDLEAIVALTVCSQ